MGGKSGGGDGGAGAMVKYGDKALDLQKKIYEENKDFIKPYYQAGNAGLNELMKRMGLGNGSGFNKTEAQLRAELAPTYGAKTTSTGAAGGAGSGEINFKGAFNPGFSSLTPEQQKTLKAYRPDLVNPTGKYDKGAMGNRGKVIAQNRQGIRDFFAGYQPPSTLDSSGLDAAVQRALAEQAAANAAASKDSNYGSLLKRFGMDDYQADPGYQFRLSEGNKALERALAAKGQFGSMNPAAAKALQDFGQQSASQEYGSAYDRFNMDQGNIFNRLAAITGIGQTATGQLTGQGNQLSNSATDILTGQGNALAAAAQQKQANKSSMFNTLLGTAGQIGAAYFMSDINLKENIVHIGQENGHNIYEFSYKDNPALRFIGVMAQEVQNTHPEAVKMIDGYLHVNYDAIGVQMREVH